MDTCSVTGRVNTFCYSSLALSSYSELVLLLHSALLADSSRTLSNSNSEKYKSASYWIGLKQVNEKWQWMDTTTVDYIAWNSFNVTAETFGVLKCMFVDEAGSWNRENCDVEHDFLCKYECMFLRHLRNSLFAFSTAFIL